MSNDFNKPVMDDEYVEIFQDIRDVNVALATMFEGGPATNTPTGAVQYLGSVLGRWNGSSFVATQVSIAGGGTGGGTATAARTNLELLSTTEINAQFMRKDSNGSDIVDDSIFRQNLDVYSKGELDTGAQERLRADSNLSDVESTKTARETLGIETITEIVGATGGTFSLPLGWVVSRTEQGVYRVTHTGLSEPNVFISVSGGDNTIRRTWTIFYQNGFLDISFRDQSGVLADTTFKSTYIDRL